MYIEKQEIYKLTLDKDEFIELLHLLTITLNDEAKHAICRFTSSQDVDKTQAFARLLYGKITRELDE
jgi:hypothetical protein